MASNNGQSTSADQEFVQDLKTKVAELQQIISDFEKKPTSKERCAKLQQDIKEEEKKQRQLMTEKIQLRKNIEEDGVQRSVELLKILDKDLTISNIEEKEADLMDKITRAELYPDVVTGFSSK